MGTRGKSRGHGVKKCRSRSGGERAARQNPDNIHNSCPPATGAEQYRSRRQTVKTADRSRLEQDAGEEKQL